MKGVGGVLTHTYTLSATHIVRTHIPATADQHRVASLLFHARDAAPSVNACTIPSVSTTHSGVGSCTVWLQLLRICSCTMQQVSGAGCFNVSSCVLL